MRKREKWYTSGLLPRMEARLWKDGKTVSYRYMHPDGRAIPLGNDKQKAILKVAKMGEELDAHGSLNNLWTLYLTSSYWANISERTRADYTAYSKHLLRVFGRVHVAAIRPTHIARYLRVERASAPVRANREIALLSNLCQLAIDHDLIDTNPCKEVRRNTELPRSTLPSQKNLSNLLTWLSNQTPQRQMIAYAAEFAALTGSRQIELLSLTWNDIELNNGLIKTKRAKQRAGKVLVDIIKITPKMTALLHNLKKASSGSSYIFTNNKNSRYTSGSFKAMWQECIKDAIKEGVIKESERFTFHDLRAFYATQFKQQLGSLPDLHANPATTAKIYERSGHSERSAL